MKAIAFAAGHAGHLHFQIVVVHESHGSFIRKRNRLCRRVEAGAEAAAVLFTEALLFTLPVLAVATAADVPPFAWVLNAISIFDLS
jgi:hypothetical protein